MPTKLNRMFDEVLEPLGDQAASFFLAASLYHAKKVSYERAAAMAGLSFEEFGHRLKEHFGTGFIIAEESVKEDIGLSKDLAE